MRTAGSSRSAVRRLRMSGKRLSGSGDSPRSRMRRIHDGTEDLSGGIRWRKSLLLLGEIARGPSKRALAVERLPKRHAVAVLVRARVGRARVVLLGGHVLQGPHDRPHLRERVRARCRWRARVCARVLVVSGCRGPHEPEVGHPGAPVRADEDVVGLEVAVHELRRVRRGEPLARVEHQPHDLAARRGGRPFEPLPQRPRLDELHRDEDKVAERPDVVHRGHVRVRELGHRLRFAQKARLRRRSPLRADGRRRFRLARTEQLHRDAPVELGIVGRIHHAAAAAANRLEDEVAANARPFREGRARLVLGRELSRDCLQSLRRAGVGLEGPRVGHGRDDRRSARRGHGGRISASPRVQGLRALSPRLLRVSPVTFRSAIRRSR